MPEQLATQSDYGVMVDERPKKPASILAFPDRKSVLRMLGGEKNSVKLEKSIRPEHTPLPAGPDQAGYDEKMMYWYQTQDLEGTSPAAQLLTALAQKMIADIPDLPPLQVYILRRGESLTAFVRPDGKIFISQSLINALGNLDEVAAVIAHEVAHVVNKSGERISKAKSTADRFGTGWVHEMASDLGAAPLLVKVGLNSTALRTAIKTISGDRRGSIHQAGNARASEIVASHFLIDTSTSHQAYRDKPEFLAAPVEPTNAEILQESLNQQDVKLFAKVLPNLHLEDLFQVSPALRKTLQTEGHAVYREFRKAYDTFLIDKLKRSGFSQDQARLAIIVSQSSNAHLDKSAHLFPTYAECVQLTQSIPAFEQGDVAERILESTNYLIDVTGTDLSSNFLDVVGHSISKKTKMDQTGFAWDENQLFLYLEEIRKLHNTLIDAGERPFNLGKEIGKFVCLYIDNVQFSITTKEKVREVLDESALRALLQRLFTWRSADKDGERFAINGEYLLSYTPPARHLGEWKRVQDIIKEVFSIQDQSPATFSREAAMSRFRNNVKDTRSDQEEQIYPLRKWKEFFRVTQAEMRRLPWNSPEKSAIVLELGAEIDTMSFDSDYDMWELLKNRSDTFWEKPELEEQVTRPAQRATDEQRAISERNQRLFALFQKVNCCLYLLIDEDTEHPDLHATLERFFTEAQIDWDSCPDSQVINILSVFFDSRIYGLTQKGLEAEWSSNHERIFRDFEALARLSPFQSLLQRSEQTPFKRVEEVLTSLNRKSDEVMVLTSQQDIFSDELISLLAFRTDRQAMLEFLAGDLPVEEWPVLYRLLAERFPARDPQVTMLCRQIGRQYILSETPSFDQKLTFISDNFDQLAGEGVNLLAEQIHDLETYTRFRSVLGTEKLSQYLSGSTATTNLAVADYATSLFANNSYDLLNTAVEQPYNVKQVSTGVARWWARGAFGRGQMYGGKKKKSPVHYQDGKFWLEGDMRGPFRSLADSFANLKALGHGTRAGIIHKALTEERGALSQRVGLTNIVQSAMHLEGLPYWLASSALKVGEPDIISFPIAQALAPKLFSALQLDSVDLEMVEDVELYEESEGIGREIKLGSLVQRSELDRIFRSSTREITIFGQDYAHQPESVISRLAQESDGQYHQAMQLLNEKFPLVDDASSVEQARSTEDAEVEAMLQALEVSGATTVRQLQLATQFFSFTPEVHRRISRCLDSNPGMSMLGGWENLYQWSQPIPSDTPEQIREKQQLAEFLSTVSIQRKIGGGSLKSVFLATDADGQEVVLRLQNPNAAFFIRSGHKLVKDTYEATKELKYAKQYRRTLKTGEMLNDLSQRWCIQDINDPHFMEDDAQFRKVIAGIPTPADVEIYAPEVRMNRQKIKVEQVAAGVTANTFLQSDAPEEHKQLLRQAMVQTFEHQLNFDANKVTGADGHEYTLAHSDPQVGNYMVITSGDKLRLGVIDRDMYLRLSREDVEIIKLFIDPTKGAAFLDALLNRILDLNKYRGISRRVTKFKIGAKVRTGVVRSQLNGGEDKLGLLQVLFESFAQEDLDIPLELQLMIRNAGLYMELKKQL